MGKKELQYYKQQKRKSFAMALMLIFCIMFSVCFIAAEAGHECSGEDCPVCASLLQCEELVQKTGTWFVSFAAFTLLFLHQIIPLIETTIQLPVKTPVTLKIQLNN